MKRRLVVALATIPLLLAACERAEITTYRVPKDKNIQVAAAPANPANTPPPAATQPPAPATQPPPTAQPAPPRQLGSNMANTAVPTATGANLTWTGPKHWNEKPASAMRKGTFSVPGEGGIEADLSITAFPGDVGGELANVNRWRSQIQLGPIAAGELAGVITRLERNGLKIAIVDVGGTGSGDQRTLGAMIPYQGATWYFKLTGPGHVLEKEKPAFLSFVDTVKPAAQ